MINLENNGTVEISSVNSSQTLWDLNITYCIEGLFYLKSGINEYLPQFYANTTTMNTCIDHIAGLASI